MQVVSDFPTQAKWIWPVDQATPNTHVLFRQDINVARDTVIDISVAAETYAQVYWDDQLIHRYNCVSYPDQHYFEHIEIEAVKSGQHKLAIVVQYIGVGSGSTTVKDPGLLCEVSSRFEDTFIASSGDWPALVLDAWKGQRRRAPFLNLDFIEYLDLRDLPPGFPSTPLQHCVTPLYVGAYPGCRMPVVAERSFPFLETKEYRDLHLIYAGLVQDSGHDDPALAITEEGKPNTLLQLESLENYEVPAPAIDQAVTFFFELGNYITGYPEMHIIAEAGAVVDIAYHEFADQYQFDFKRSKLSAADRFTLREGLNVIKPEEWKALRYLQITIRQQTQPCIIKDLLIEQSEYPLQERLSLQCEHKVLQKIVDISLNATRLCMHGIMMDCPWREKRQWIGDVQRIALVNHYSFQDTALVRAVLLQHSQLQTNAGQMWPCQPLQEELPSQSMEWLRAVLEYDYYTDDQTLLQELYPSIQRLQLWFARWINADGLFHPTDPRTTQWMENTFGSIRKYGKTAPFAFLNLRYAQCLEDFASVYERFDNTTAAEAARTAAAALKQIIVETYYDAERGVLVEQRASEAPIIVAECTQALAICLDLPGINNEAVWEAYLQIRETDIMHIGSSPFGKYHTHEALGKLGRSDALLQDIIDNWAPMVQAGSKTTWEVFSDGGHESLSAHSQCHAWAAIPVIAVIRHVLGADIKAAELPGALEHALGSIAVSRR